MRSDATSEKGGKLPKYRSSACCFTGHRDISDYDRTIRARLCVLVDLLIDRGIRCFIFGGARGFDTLAANVVAEFLRAGENISMKFILPSADYPFDASDLATDLISRYPDSVRVEAMFGVYTTGVNHARNKRMVDESCFCISYLDPKSKSGGTLYTVNYARSINVPTFNVYFDLPQDIDLPL